MELEQLIQTIFLAAGLGGIVASSIYEGVQRLLISWFDDLTKEQRAAAWLLLSATATTITFVANGGWTGWKSLIPLAITILGGLELGGRTHGQLKKIQQPGHMRREQVNK